MQEEGEKRVWQHLLRDVGEMSLIHATRYTRLTEDSLGRSRGHGSRWGRIMVHLVCTELGTRVAVRSSATRFDRAWRFAL